MSKVLNEMSHNNVDVSVRVYEAEVGTPFELVQVDAGDHYHVHCQFFHHPLGGQPLIHSATDVHYVVTTNVQPSKDNRHLTIHTRNTHGVSHRATFYFHDDDSFRAFMKEMLHVYAATA